MTRACLLLCVSAALLLTACPDARVPGGSEAEPALEIASQVDSFLPIEVTTASLVGCTGFEGVSEDARGRIALSIALLPGGPSAPQTREVLAPGGRLSIDAPDLHGRTHGLCRPMRISVPSEHFTRSLLVPATSTLRLERGADRELVLRDERGTVVPPVTAPLPACESARIFEERGHELETGPQTMWTAGALEDRGRCSVVEARSPNRVASIDTCVPRAAWPFAEGAIFTVIPSSMDFAVLHTNDGLLTFGVMTPQADLSVEPDGAFCMDPSLGIARPGTLSRRLPSGEKRVVERGEVISRETRENVQRIAVAAVFETYARGPRSQVPLGDVILGVELDHAPVSQPIAR